MYRWVQCPYCRRIQECWFDGYEYECPTYEKTFTLSWKGDNYDTLRMQALRFDYGGAPHERKRAMQQWQLRTQALPWRIHCSRRSRAGRQDLSRPLLGRGFALKRKAAVTLYECKFDGCVMIKRPNRENGRCPECGRMVYPDNYIIDGPQPIIPLSPAPSKKNWSATGKKAPFMLQHKW